MVDGIGTTAEEPDHPGAEIAVDICPPQVGKLVSAVDVAAGRGTATRMAGIGNRPGNGLCRMPHTERCWEPVLGGTDGNFIFQSIIESGGSR